jgi:hypothetical protein
MNDRGLGALIVLFSLIFMAGYFIWAFPWIFGETVNNLIGPISEWAFKLPVALAVYMILAIILWIGYTMATTPPPMPLERPLEIEREEVSGIKEAEGEER